MTERNLSRDAMIALLKQMLPSDRVAFLRWISLHHFNGVPVEGLTLADRQTARQYGLSMHSGE